jgi:hypothetical protein
MWENKSNNQRLFECGVCMEDKHKVYVIQLDPCGHEFCKTCVKKYVDTKLAERCFPIRCPVCMTQDGDSEPGRE